MTQESRAARRFEPLRRDPVELAAAARPNQALLQVSLNLLPWSGL